MEYLKNVMHCDLRKSVADRANVMRERVDKGQCLNVSEESEDRKSMMDAMDRFQMPVQGSWIYFN